MNVRRGASLIECSVAMTLIGATLTSAALLTHTVRRADRRVRDAAALETELGRLAAQLRTDAHRAASARIENPQAPDRAVLSLDLPDGLRAEYTVVPRRVQRVLRRGESTLHRESYALDPANVGRWAVRDGERSFRGAKGDPARRPVVSLVLEPAPGCLAPAPAGRIDAAVNLFGPPVPAPKP